MGFVETKLSIMKTAFKVWVMALAAAGALGLTSGCASDGSRRSTGEYIDDTAIRTKLKAALVNDPEIKSDTFKTDVDRGNVVFTGFVRSEHERNKVENTAKGIKGVKAVYNQLTISDGSTPGPVTR
jgi:osmotically-inducible protein OsmY